MSTSQSTPPAAHKATSPQRRRRLQRILLGGMLGLAALIVSYSWWLAPLTLLLAPKLALNFGYKLSIGAIERMDLGGVRLRQVHLVGLESGLALTSLQADAIEVTYSPELLAGNLEALESLSGKHIQLALLTDREPVQNPGDSEPEPFSLPESLPRVNLEDIQLELRGENESRHSIAL
ncbi:MAG: hypothetical protein ACI9F9_002974, partial [Candidatus Paceibacteria bacterium]